MLARNIGCVEPRMSRMCLCMCLCMCRSVGEPRARAVSRVRLAGAGSVGRGYERQPNVKDQTLLKRFNHFRAVCEH